MLDLVIRGGTVYDGSGAPGQTADIGIREAMPAGFVQQLMWPFKKR